METIEDRDVVADETMDNSLGLNDWQVAAIAKAVAEANVGGPFVSDEDMTAWLLSWGTDHELPPPVSQAFRPKAL
jgi:predicted transcriptional regulator